MLLKLKHDHLHKSNVFPGRGKSKTLLFYIYTALHSGYNHISVTKTFQNIETNYFLPNPTSDYILKEVIRYPKSLTFICFAGHGLLILVYI